jgi:hypothetical protein
LRQRGGGLKEDGETDMDGDRVIPRFKTDVSDATLVLPVTGGG